MTDNLNRLIGAGVSIWREDLPLAGLRERPGPVSGVVAGAAALQQVAADDVAVRRFTTGATDADDAVRRLTAGYARSAADGGARPVVVEIDPALAGDTAATVAEARRLYALIDRPDVLVAVPVTAAAPAAVAELTAAGIGVAATFAFSPARIREVLDAAGGPLVVAVPVADVDTEVDKRLWAIGTDASARLRGTAALANSRLAHAAFENALRGPRWVGSAARPTLAWTSTRVRDPYYLETRYVDELVAAGAVTVLSKPTYEAVEEFSELRGETVRGSYEEAYTAMEALVAVGIDRDDVYRTLLDKALAKAAGAWQKLRDTAGAGLRQTVA